MITIFTRIDGGYITLKAQEASLKESQSLLESHSNSDMNPVTDNEVKND